MQLIFIAGLLVVLAVFIYTAVKRSSRRFLVGRIVLAVLALVALYFMAFPFYHTVNVDTASAILLTEGYNQDSLNNLLNRNEEKPLVLNYGVVEENGTGVLNTTDLKLKFPEVNKLAVLGYGLSEDELQGLQNVEINASLSPVSGITNVHWPKQINLGQTLVINGKFNKSAGSPKPSIKLIVAGTTVDSVEIETGNQENFTLKYTPKVSGRFLYSLLIDDGEENKEEILPVQVAPQKPLDILMLAAQPVAEFKFLKNALANQQHKLVIRTEFSKDKYYNEWLNTEQVNINRLSPEILSRYDLVISDAQTIHQLNRAEQSALQQSVKEDGLGLLLIPDELPLRNISLFSDFSFTRRSKDAMMKEASLKWEGLNSSVPETEILPYSVNTQNSYPIAVTKDSVWVVAASQSGWGNVAVTALNNTFQWTLSGKQEVYNSYWTNLLNKLAKKEIISRSVAFQPVVPLVQYPVKLQLTDYSEEQTGPLRVLSDSGFEVNIALAQDPQITYKFSGSYWPDKAGWHAVFSESSTDTSYFYVFDESAWKGVRLTEMANATQAKVIKQEDKLVAKELLETQEPVNPVYFYLLFIFSIGLIWLEEKL